MWSDKQSVHWACEETVGMFAKVVEVGHERCRQVLAIRVQGYGQIYGRDAGHAEGL